MNYETNIDREGRFWDRVILHKADQCWRWAGPRGPAGYGEFSIRRGQWAPAHRFAFMLENGPIPDGLVVRHKCDNPGCVNPRHLEIGTRGDNSQDAHDRGRMGYRDWVGTSKLTKCQLEAIQVRALIEPHDSLAREFGISKSVVQKLVNIQTETAA